MRRLGGHTLFVATIAATIGAVAAPAQAADRKWLPPVALGEPAITPVTAMDRNGGALILFERPTLQETEIMATARPAGGDFSSATVVPWLQGANIASAYDSDGRSALAWVTDTRGAGLQYLVTDPNTGTKRSATLLAGESTPMSPTMQADGDGNVYVAWFEQEDGRGCCIGPYVARMKDGEGFGSPRLLSDEVARTSLFLDVSETGAAVVSWVDDRGHMAAVRPPGGAFGPPEQVKKGDGTYWDFQEAPSLSIDDAGEVLFALNAEEATDGQVDGKGQLVVTVRHPDGTYSEPQSLSTSVNAGGAKIAAGPSGEAVVAWTEGEESNASLLTSVRSLDGSFSTPVTVASKVALTGEAPQVGMDAAGNAIVTWALHEELTAQILAAHRPPLGEFGPAQLISAPIVPQGEGDAPLPELTVGGPGNAIVTWYASTDADWDYWLEAGVFDIAPPVVPEFEVVTGGTEQIEPDTQPVGASAARRKRRVTFHWRVSEHSDVRIKLRRRGRMVKILRTRAAPGENVLKLRTRRLKPGRYKAILRARDRLRNRSRPRTARFKVRALEDRREGRRNR